MHGQYLSLSLFILYTNFKFAAEKVTICAPGPIWMEFRLFPILLLQNPPVSSGRGVQT